MIDFLTLLIVGAALLQPTSERMAVALTFAAFTFVHNTFMHNFEGMMYYATDALFYLMVIFIVGLVDSKTSLIYDIQKISIVAVALDYFGWAIYMMEIPPTGYNVAFMALYAWTIIILLRRDQANDGSNAMDSGFASIRAHARSGHTLNSSH